LKTLINRWRSCLAALVLAAAVAAPVAAYVYQTEFYIYAAGQNGDHINARSYIRSGTYPTGPTWVQVRFPAYPSSSCREGFPYAGGCADSARSEGAGIWWSLAEVRGPYYPYGCWYAETQQYIEGFIQRNSGIQQCYGEPPPACDPALDGSYQPGACVSPIVIDTGKKQAYKFDPRVRVQFDLDADGVADTVGWTKHGSKVALLAYDRNGNGVIDSGKELFGNFTNGSSDGFAALAKEAGAAGQSEVNASNPLFAKLLLWRDANQDGYSQPEELAPANDELSAIGLGYFLTSAEPDKVGNELRLGGWARLLDGTQIKIYDVYFQKAQ
jgi:hypothetical protein